jgi:ATP-dependent helicase/nuclease subunit A
MPLREIVEAGAGCGKTTGLVDRYVAALGLHKDSDLNKRYAPSTRRLPQAREVLALTFTNEAARQMQERVLKKLLEDGHRLEARSVLEESQISTYHSFCLRVLQPYLVKRGFEGPLLSPALASYLRREYLLRALSEYPQASEVRKALALPKILSLGCKLWFHPLGSNPAEKLISTYTLLEQRFDEFRRATRAKAEPLMAVHELREKKPKYDGWLHRLVEALQEPTAQNFAKISFTKGPRWIAAENPELKRDAEDLREFFVKGYGAFLDPECRAEEIRSQEILWNFMTWALPRAPKIFDFEAAEQELLKLLEESGSTRLVPPPKLILVDEFQDTNSLQYEIIQRISDNETEWYFVGDPKQSIYAFRGGDVQLFYRLRDELERKGLDTNYRSHTRVLELVNRLQEKIFRPEENTEDPAPQTLKWPESKEAGELSLHWLRSGDSTLVYARDLLLKNREHFETSSTAVLFRSWSKLYAFADLLRQSGQKFRIAGSENPFEHLLTDLFCSYLVSQDNPKNLEGFWSMERWRTPSDFSWESLATPSQLIERHRIQEKSCLSTFQVFCQKIEVRRFAGAELWVPAMERWLQDRVSEGFSARMTRTQLAHWIQQHRGELEAENPYRITPDEPEHPSLTLLTLHASKGLEFRHVYLPELFERSQSHQEYSLESDEGELLLHLDLKGKNGEERRSLAFEIEKHSKLRAKGAEEKRLLYVALTRAIETLHIVGHQPKAPSSEAINAPLRVVGHTKARPEYWHEALAALTLDDIAAITHVEETSDPAPQEAGTLPRWNLPLSPAESKRALRPLFQRCGVSRYLDLQTEESHDEGGSRSKRHSVSSFDFAKQSDVGTDFHALLEIWNGDLARLPRLVSSLDPRVREGVEDAAKALRALPELHEYWQALLESPERVQREFGVFLISPSYRLSGFADVVWFQSEEEIRLIDWKSGSSLRNLASEERLKKFREQLQLYAKGFDGLFSKIHLEVYGIELGERPRAARVLSESLS